MFKPLLLLALAFCATVSAQTPSCASFLRPAAKADITIPYQYNAAGVATPIEWGLDLAWKDEANLRTGVFYAGRDLVDIVRLSFQPTKAMADSTWSEEQRADLKYRADAVLRWAKPNVKYNLNDDPVTVDAYYNEGSAGSAERGRRWAQLIDLTADYYKSRGLTNLVSISPFNEPDYGWGQGYSSSTRKADFKAVCQALRSDYGTKYDGVRLCGGNTLNDDEALSWWTYLRDVLEEGNTHQLAGDFDHYADFFREVRAAGHHATADELHNVMEAMTGVEYGMQTGIWWGTAERTRSEFMKATYHANPGRRLAYAEHRANWTSASVYALPDGRVEAFGGMSERQSATTHYMFLATDGPVWYDGLRGPAYVMHLPGGTGYQQGQTGAEVCTQIERGTDIMPHIGEGVYKLMNVGSGLLAGYTSKPTSGWTTLLQRKNSNTAKPLQWMVTPLTQTGDFSYYTFVLNTDNGMYLDVRDWNYEAGADVGVYPGDGNVLEQFYLEYAGRGAYYIRSRYSTKCLEVKNGSHLVAANIEMADFTGADSQQWRFIDVKTTPDLIAPAAPASLVATAQTASVRLDWEPSAERDLKSYTILRDTTTLARDLTSTSFVDNEALPGHTYNYKVYAEDKSLNRSEPSNAAEATVGDEPALVMHLPLTAALRDTTENGNHAALAGDTVFTTQKNHACLTLDGTTNFLQLPPTVASRPALTLTAWVYYRGGSTWQRIFDFGNGTSHYLFLTPNCGSGMRLALKDGGDEQQINTATMTANQWHHVCVTLAAEGMALYVDGKLKGQNATPYTLQPALNFVGRSQFPADPYFKGYIHDLCVYNRVLTAEEIKAMTDGIENVNGGRRAVYSPCYDLQGRPYSGRGIAVRDGRKILK